MVDDMLCVLYVEVLQNGDYDGSVGDGGHVDFHPLYRVFAHEGYLVALLDAEGLEEHVRGNAMRLARSA